MDRSLISKIVGFAAVCLISMGSMAAPGSSITFTENSSSDLAVTSTGISGISFSVASMGTDRWRVTWSFADTTSALSLVTDSASSRQWFEPENQNEVNLVTWGGSFFDVFSDVDAIPEANGGAPNVDGTAVFQFIEYSFFDDPDTFINQVAIVFNDAGDSAMPEPGALSLIGLSLCALGWSRRRTRT